MLELLRSLEDPEHNVDREPGNVVLHVQLYFILSMLKAISVRTSIHGGWPAQAPFASQNSEWPPFWLPFRSEWAPLGGPGDQNFDAKARLRAPFFCSSSPFGESKNIKVGVCKKSFETPSGSSSRSCASVCNMENVLVYDKIYNRGHF